MRPEFEKLTDAEIDTKLREEYPPADYSVAWWWAFPDERRGFCLSVAMKYAITQADVERNLYEL